MEDFEKIIVERYNLEHDEVRAFFQHAKFITLNKNELIVEKGKFNDNFYVLKKGILRAFIPSDGEEQTVWFTFPGQIMYDVPCYVKHEKSDLSMVGATPCEFYYLTKNEIERLCSESLLFCNFMRKILLGIMFEIHDLHTSLADCTSGIDKYSWLVERYPQLMRCIPLNKLASYLHLAPQSLSRIRSQIK